MYHIVCIIDGSSPKWTTELHPVALDVDGFFANRVVVFHVVEGLPNLMKTLLKSGLFSGFHLPPNQPKPSQSQDHRTSEIREPRSSGIVFFFGTKSLRGSAPIVTEVRPVAQLALRGFGAARPWSKNSLSNSEDETGESGEANRSMHSAYP